MSGWAPGTGKTGPPGPTGPASTIPGPTGPASTVPGPTGPASTVPGPTGPASTVAGPTGPASTVPGPTGPAGPGFKSVAGSVNGAGTAIRGTGFTSTLASTGIYNITFSPAFTGVPIVVGSPNNNDQVDLIFNGAATGGVTANVIVLAGTPISRPFDFQARDAS